MRVESRKRHAQKASKPAAQLGKHVFEGADSMSDIIEINGNAVRFKYILMVGPVINGTFKVPIALGFELPVKGTQADRDALVQKWVEWMAGDNETLALEWIRHYPKTAMEAATSALQGAWNEAAGQ